MTSTISTNVVLSMGSTSTQGAWFDSKGKVHILFQEGITNPPGIKTKDTPENREHLKDFLYYVAQFVHLGKRVIIVNSAGYSIDGGKKKGDQIGDPYSLIDNIENFADKSFVGILSDIVLTPGNESLRSIFTVVNRNYKTSDGEEISGQWAKQIKDYLISLGLCNIRWMVDIGGKSATLYKRQDISSTSGRNDYIFVKEGTYFSEVAPNTLIKTPNEFRTELSTELEKMVIEKGVVLKDTCLLQTGMARDENTDELFSKEVAYHGFLPQAVESQYEAVDFCRTVIKSDISTGCTLTATSKGSITVHNIPTSSILGGCSIM